MSYDGDTLTVLKGVTHGAVDFLIKPVRLAELSNMWQHVVRKRRQQVSDSENQIEMGARLYGSLSDDLEGDGRPGSASAAGAAACTGWSCRLLFNTLMTVPQYLRQYLRTSDSTSEPQTVPQNLRQYLSTSDSTFSTSDSTSVPQTVPQYLRQYLSTSDSTFSILGY
jgi:hypothetical protein